MRFASLKDRAAPDGTPCLVSRDGATILPLPADVAPSLLSLLQRWEEHLGKLRSLHESLHRGTARGIRSVDGCQFAPPLPRTWAFLDGSAFLAHIRRARQARGAPMPKDIETVPLMYQGASDGFGGPKDPIELASPDFGYDYEGEFCVVTGSVPQSITAVDGLAHVRLVMLMNDISLRHLIPAEMATGFGFLQSKPPSSFAPYAVTPDELGDAWQNGRVVANLQVQRNGRLCGDPSGTEMHFHFGQLIAHAARTRALSAGTIIGSGTVSNEDEARGTACIVESRAIEQLQGMSALTPFLHPGDLVEMRVEHAGRNVFGSLCQRCV